MTLLGVLLIVAPLLYLTWAVPLLRKDNLPLPSARGMGILILTTVLGMLWVYSLGELLLVKYDESSKTAIWVAAVFCIIAIGVPIFGWLIKFAKSISRSRVQHT